MNTRLRGATAHMLITLLLIFANPARAEDEVVLGERIGPVTAHSTAKSLAAELGRENVVNREEGVGEGDVQMATVVFSGSRREMVVFWNDIEELSHPNMVRITRPGTPWVSPAGITVGSTLKDLHEANGGPFEIYGFDWDYGGALSSWSGGKLESTHGMGRLFSGMMGYDYFKLDGSDRELKVIGDSPFPSTHPDFAWLDVSLHEIDYHFPGILDRESVGPLRIGLGEEAARDAVPVKPKIGREEMSDATGMFTEDWIFPGTGVSLWMSSEEKGGEKTVESITVVAPSTFKTARGIGIGAREADVEKAYANEKEKSESTPGELFVAGSIYGGVIFEIENGQVEKIFLGAAAE